jgi:hypothetical protein
MHTTEDTEEAQSYTEKIVIILCAVVVQAICSLVKTFLECEKSIRKENPTWHRLFFLRDLCGFSVFSVLLDFNELL